MEGGNLENRGEARGHLTVLPFLLRAIVLAVPSFPQMNIVGGPPFSLGLTMRALPTLLNALTKRALGAALCSRSIRESSRVVKKLITPFTGGASAIGLVASMTILPASACAPA